MYFFNARSDRYEFITSNTGLIFLKRRPIMMLKTNSKIETVVFNEEYYNVKKFHLNVKSYLETKIKGTSEYMFLFGEFLKRCLSNSPLWATPNPLFVSLLHDIYDAENQYQNFKMFGEYTIPISFHYEKYYEKL